MWVPCLTYYDIINLLIYYVLAWWIILIVYLSLICRDSRCLLEALSPTGCEPLLLTQCASIVSYILTFDSMVCHSQLHIYLFDSMIFYTIGYIPTFDSMICHTISYILTFDSMICHSQLHIYLFDSMIFYTIGYIPTFNSMICHSQLHTYFWLYDLP